jgi:hypothetical protein
MFANPALPRAESEHGTRVPNRYGLSRLLCLFLAGLALGASVGFAGQSEPVAFDLRGQPANPFVQTNIVATVLVFVAVDCPISNRYAPELQRLRKQFVPLGLSFWMVYPDKETSRARIRQHAQDFGLGDQILWDPKHVLVRAAHARITPEVAVFTRPDNLVYHGQIDDRFVNLSTARPEPTRRYLQETLDALVNHEPIRTRETQAVGCSIAE